MAKIDRKNTSKALFKNTGIIAIGQVSTKLINFFLLPLYTAILSREEYGLVDLLTTYSNLLTVLVGFQMIQAIFRFLVTCREDEKRIRSVVSTIFYASFCIIAIYSVLFCAIQPFVRIEFKWYLLIHVIVAIYLQTMSGVARGLGHNGDYAVGNFLSAATSLVLNVIVIAVLRLGVGAMLVSYIIGPVIGGTYIFFRNKIHRFIRLRSASKDELKTILKYAVPLVPNELSWSVIHSSDKIVISTFLSVAANGIIAVACKFSTIYTTVFSIFNSSWTEQVVLHYKDEGGPEYISHMFDKVITFFGSIAIGIVACMPFVFDILVDSKFRDAYQLVPLYMTAVFFNAVIGMISAIYLIENETKLVAISTMVAAIINLSVDLMLVKLIGTFAAPISSICGYAFISFWRLYDINKRHCKITMSKKKVILLISMMTATVSTYYFNNILLHIVSLIYVVSVALSMNWKSLGEFSGVILGKFKNRR